jgi:hypothetical protein
MSAKGQDWAREALAPYLGGCVLELEGVGGQPLSGARRIERGTTPQGHPLQHVTDASADAVVGIGATQRGGDPIESMREWRRVLREGGALALIVAETGDPERGGHASWGTPQGLVSLLRLVGGFEVQKLEPLREAGAWLLVAARSAIAEIREPFGALGSGIARVAGSDPRARAELYFQIGTVLLQAGDAERGLGCFEALARLEPDSSEAHFGRGMCLARLERWSQALTELQRAAALDPGNAQIARWIELASERIEAPRTLVPSTSPADPVRATVAGGLRI